MESTASSLEACVGEEIADIQTPAKLQNAALLPHCMAYTLKITITIKYTSAHVRSYLWRSAQDVVLLFWPLKPRSKLSAFRICISLYHCGQSMGFGTRGLGWESGCLHSSFVNLNMPLNLSVFQFLHLWNRNYSANFAGLLRGLNS